jgi:hypothetical protein
MAAALTGHPGAASINITSKMLRKLQEKHGNELDIWWKEQFGFGIESLTQGEAGHLAKAPTLDAIRDSIVGWVRFFWRSQKNVTQQSVINVGFIYFVSLCFTTLNKLIQPRL